MHVSHCQGRHSTAFINWEEPWRNPQRLTILHPQHHCCGPILQICPLQHLQNPVFPNVGCNATLGPSTGHSLLDYCKSLLAGLLVFATTPLQHASFSIYPNSSMWPPSSMTSSNFLFSPHPIQGNGAGLQGHQQTCNHLPPISWLAGTTIAESKQRSLSIVATPLCSGTSVVEWTHDQCQDSRIPRHLRLKTQTHLFRLHLDPTEHVFIWTIVSANCPKCKCKFALLDLCLMSTTGNL